MAEQIMTKRKEIKELSEWLTNLTRAYEASISPDLPDWSYKYSRVLVYTINDSTDKSWVDTYLSELTDNKKQYGQLYFMQYVTARDWASDSSIWPRDVPLRQFLEWQQNIPEIKERWNTLQDLIDEIKEYDKS